MRKIHYTPLAALASATLLTATGCASAPDRPEQQLVRAETSVEFAEESGAVEYRAQALDRARAHLADAQDAADDGEYDIALRAAEKAEIDAELAAAQSNRLKADEALAEIRESIDILRREIASSRSS